MVRLGWKAGPEQYGPVELLDYAIAAEEAGFDSLEASDHFHPWSESGQACFVWTWLGAAAARTGTIRLGTGVTCPILRYHPAVIAQASATLGVMAPGRAFLAVGTGEALNEYSSTGAWPEYEDRQDMMEEAVGLIRELWTGKPVTHHGEYYETHMARLYTRPEEPVPLYIASMAPGSATFAGQHGDGLMTVGGQSPDLYKEILQRFDEAAREAGKEPATLPKMIEINVAYTEDEEGAIRCMQQYWAATFVPALFDQRIYTPAMSEKNGEVVGADIIRSKMCISSNPQDHVEYAQQYIDLGFNEIFFHSPGPDQKTFLEGYGRDVLPKIRESAGTRNP